MMKQPFSTEELALVGAMRDDPRNDRRRLGDACFQAALNGINANVIRTRPTISAEELGGILLTVAASCCRSVLFKPERTKTTLSV